MEIYDTRIIFTLNKEKTYDLRACKYCQFHLLDGLPLSLRDIFPGFLYFTQENIENAGYLAYGYKIMLQDNI